MSNETPRRMAPYASPPHVLQLISRYRERGLPKPLSKADIEAMSIPSSSAFRSLQALKFLGLIDDAGYPTEQFDQLKRAGNDEYKAILADVVRNAYATVFNYIDPAQDSMEQIQNAFRRYDPVSELNRMANLFMALCSEAGIVSEEKRPKPTPPRTSKPVSQAKRTPERRNEERSNNGNHEEQGPLDREPPRRDNGIADIPDDYRLIVELLYRLPKDQKWSLRQRELWLGAMEANINVVVEVVDDIQQQQNVSEQV